MHLPRTAPPGEKTQKPWRVPGSVIRSPPLLQRWKSTQSSSDPRCRRQTSSAAQAKAVEYIEELDERLAVEQAVIEEQKALIGHLQESLTEKTSKEASSATRLVMTEGALGELKQEARALRVALRQAQTNADEAKAKMPQSGCQTEWQTVHMPLPCLPHGGTWSAGGKKPEVVRERPPPA